MPRLRPVRRLDRPARLSDEDLVLVDPWQDLAPEAELVDTVSPNRSRLVPVPGLLIAEEEAPL